MTSVTLLGHHVRKTIELTSIAYLQADSNYTTFYFTSGPAIMVAKTLKKYENLPGFIRVNRNTLVNKEVIERIGYYEANLFTVSGLCFPVARRRLQAIIAGFYW